jgi:hypothetical protein
LIHKGFILSHLPITRCHVGSMILSHEIHDLAHPRPPRLGFVLAHL